MTTEDLMKLRELAEDVRDAELPHPKWLAENAFKAAFNYGTAIELLDALEAQGREVARLTVERDVNKRMRDQHFAELAAIRAQESVIDFTVLHQFAAAQAISYNKLCTAVRMAVASSVPTQDVGALVEVIQEAADRLEGIKGGSVSETIAMMRAAITQSQAARVPDASPAAKDAGLVAALQKIADWNSHTAEFSMDYGSNGLRDLYRQIARDALSKIGGV